MRRRALAVALIPVSVVLAGCGSTTSASQSPSAAQAVSQEAAANPQISSTSASTPNTSGPASFVVNAGTHAGDAVKIEGWFGPPMPAGESSVEQTALSQCASPTDDGRAIVVALDVTATMESSLAGEVELNLGTFAPETLAEYVLGFSSGAQCEAGVGSHGPGIKLGTLQPHQSAHFAMWIAFINAITPSDPRPSEATLRRNDWLMSVPYVTVDGESGQPLLDEQPSATGPRVVQCIQTSYTAAEDSLAIIGGTPKVVHAQMCP